MVENSLGRLWVEGHPDEGLKTEWKYYLEEAGQEPAVQKQLAEIRKEYASLTPEQITCIDPCAGSGHILAYLFDVLMQIYDSYGYTTREAVRLIIERNLYGLDVDDRAAQLAYFTVMWSPTTSRLRIAGPDGQTFRPAQERSAPPGHPAPFPGSPVRSPAPDVEQYAGISPGWAWRS